MNAKRMVIKVGTSTLTYPTGKLNLRCIEQLVRVVSDLHNAGVQPVLVSSGAVAVGSDKLGLAQRPRTTRMKQAAAAVGQCELMHIYDKMFLEYGVTVAQVLLTGGDVDLEVKRSHIRNTFDALLENGVVPIVNENDTVAVEELEAVETFGDNDTLSAVVSKLCGADLLVIMSDIDGLYDSDPRSNPNARLIPTVDHIDDSLRSMAGGPGSANGTGGMATKLTAAQICMDGGIDMIITRGDRAEVLYHIAEGRQVGTLFKGGKTCVI